MSRERRSAGRPRGSSGTRAGAGSRAGLEPFPLADRGRERDRSAASRRADRSRTTGHGRRVANPAFEARRAVEEHRARRRAQRRRRLIGVAVIVCVVLVATAVIILRMMAQQRRQPQLRFVYPGQMELGPEITALVIRDEQLVVSPATGTVDRIVPEGYHAAADELIARVVDDSLKPVLEQRLAIDRQISERQLELIATGRNEGAQIVYGEADQAIRPLVRRLRAAGSTGDVSPFDAIEQALSLTLRARSEQLAQLDFEDSLLHNLKLERDKLQAILGGETGELRADRPGLVSFFSDGRESQLGAGLVDSLTLGQLRVELQQGSDFVALPGTRAQGEPLLRRIYGVSWHLALDVEGIDKQWFDRRSSLDLRYGPDYGRRLRARVARIHEGSDGLLVLAATDDDLARLLNTRQLPLRLVTGVVEGIRVPLGALYERSEDGKTAALLLVSANRATRLEVELLGEDGHEAIVRGGEALVEGSLIVVNPTVVEEGGLIDG